MPVVRQWIRDYAKKRMSAEDALLQIRSGSRVFLSPGCGEPQHLLEELVRLGTEGHRLNDVEIVQVEGMLTDHYDPLNKRLALSAHNYSGYSLAALGVAAHEAGHAIQHKQGYAMMKVRQTIAPAVQFAAPVAYFIFGWGFFLGGAFIQSILPFAIAALMVMVVFQLVTLPVEFDASRRAKAQLVGLGILGRDEMVGVDETLNAAALTYVAAFVDSLGKLLYLVLLFTGGRRDD